MPRSVIRQAIFCVAALLGIGCLIYATAIARVVQNPAVVADPRPLAEARRLWQEANQFWERKALDRALSDGEKSLELLRKVCPPSDAELTVRLADLARMYRQNDQAHWSGDPARMNRQNAQAHRAGLLFQEAIDGLRRAAPPRPGELAACLHQRAGIHHLEQEPDKGREALVEAVDLFRDALPADPGRLIDCLMDLSSAHAEAKAYGRSARALVEAISLLRASRPPRPDDLAECLQRLGRLKLEDGKPDDARPLLEEAAGIWRNVPPSHPSNRVGVLAGLSWIYRVENQPEKARTVLSEARTCANQARIRAEQLVRQAEYLQALPLQRENLEIAHILNPPGHPTIASRLIDLGDLLEFLGNYREAEANLREALEILRKASPDGNRETARGLAVLVRLENETAQSESARAHIQELLKILVRLVDDHPVFVGSTWSELGKIAANLGERKLASRLMTDAVALLNDKAPREAPERWKALLKLVQLQELVGERARQELLFSELTKAVEGLPPLHPFRVDFAEEMVRRNQSNGRNAEAATICRDTIELAKRILPANHPELAMLKNVLGNLLWTSGDIAAGEAAYWDAIQVVDKNLPFGHPTIVSIYSNLAELYMRLGKDKEAKIILESVLNDRKAALPPDHPMIAMTLMALANAQSSLREFEGAKKRYEEALAILEKKNHTNIWLAKVNLSGLYADQGDRVTAGRLLDEALREVEEHNPPGHRVRLELNERIFSQHFQTGRMDSALRLAREALDHHRRLLEQSAAFQSERQQFLAVFALRGHLDNYLSAAHAQGTPVDEVYGEVLKWKGIVTYRQESERRIRLALAAQNFDKAILEDLAQLRKTVGELEAMSYAPPALDRQEREDRNRAIRSLTERREQLELSLRRRDRSFEPVSLPDAGSIQAALSAQARDVALVDFLEHQFLVPPREGAPGRKEDRISAFIIRPDRPIQWVDLGQPPEIHRSIEEWRTAVAQGAIPTHSATELREKVWDKIKPYLQGAKLILVSPDGDLSRLPLAALPGGVAGKYLVHDHAFVVVPTPAKLPELLAKPKASTAGRGDSLLLVGNIDYDAIAGAKLAKNPDRAVTPGAEPQYKPLENAEAEMNGVRESFLAAFPMARERTLTGSVASKAAYLEEASRHRWHHLITHGFFAPIPSGPEDAGPRFLGKLLASAAEDPALWNPALMSGLAFAGANRQARPIFTDGILTALATSELDLQGVELVTLAACETGLGKVADGEGGVLSLQRGFQMAGARSVVASYWRVGDRATREFFDQFYGSLWKDKLGKLESFHRAQLWMIDHYVPSPEERGRGAQQRLGKPLDPKLARPSEKRDALPPFFWSGFALSGDWR